MSPFLAAFLGGLLGGITCGVAIVLMIALFGRKFAESFFQEQVAYLEKRFQERVLDGLLSKIAGFLDQGERIGQIAKRVVEVVQLLFKRKLPEDLAPNQSAVGATGLAQGHATVGIALAALGRKDDARRSFEEALRLDPKNTMARVGMIDLTEASAKEKVSAMEAREKDAHDADVTEEPEPREEPKSKPPPQEPELPFAGGKDAKSEPPPAKEAKGEGHGRGRKK